MRERRNPASAKLARGRKIRQEELKEAAVIDAMGDGLVLVDTNGKITAVNPALEKLTGYSKDEFIGKDAVYLAKKIVKPEDLGIVTKALKAGLEGKVAPFIAFTIVSKDGREIHVSGSGSTIKDAKDKSTAIVVTFKDIAMLKRVDEERIKAEAAAKAARESAVVIDAMDDGLLLVGMNGKITLVNSALEKMTGYKKSEIVGKNVVDLTKKVVKTEDLEKAMKGLRTALKGKLFLPSETLALATKDGREVSVIVTTSFMKNSEGKPSNVIFVFKDITERKQTEERYHTIVKTSIDGFWIADMQGRLLEINDAYCRMIGYSRDELLKMKITDIEAIEKPRETAQRIRKVIKTGGDRFETKHRHKDGKIINVEVSVNYLPVEDGRMVVFLRDITERKRVEKEMKESREKYKELTNSITDIFFALDKDLKYSYWNKASEKLTGISWKDAIGKYIYDIFPDNEETRKAINFYKYVLKTQRPKAFVNRYHLGDKDYFFEISAYPTKDGLCFRQGYHRAQEGGGGEAQGRGRQTANSSVGEVR